MEKTKQINQSNWIIDILKGTVFAIIISMILIIVFAIVIRFTNLSDSVIMPINQIIKGVSLLVGTIIALKGSTKGFVKGILIGLFYAVLSYIIFSVLSSTISFGITTITDILFDSMLGAISGLIAVNIK